jgi:hypothetical protein
MEVIKERLNEIEKNIMLKSFLLLIMEAMLME